MKDKGITKCFIAVTVLIAIVAMAPVLSITSVASAQSKELANVRVENVVNVDSCPYAAEHCPQLSNTGMTTYIKTIFTAGGHYAEQPLNVGRWGEKPTADTFLTFVGKEYYIRTEVPKPVYTVVLGPNHWVVFKLVGTNIQGDCAGSDKCTSILGQGGARVVVNYNWRHDDHQIGTIHLIIVNKSSRFQPALYNTKIFVFDDTTKGVIKELIPSEAAGNHYDVNGVTVGHQIRIVSEPKGPTAGNFKYEEARLFTPPDSQKLCGTFVRFGAATCTFTMPAQGPGQAYAIQVRDDVYHEYTG
jgi:hypothetical protein